MVITAVNLSNFRNFKEKKLTFSKSTTIIVGPNASGKTNILEGIYLLSTGKSFKAQVEEEMVNYEEEISRVKGRVLGGGSRAGSGDEEKNMEVVLTRGKIKVGEDPLKIEKVPRKKLLVNGVSKRLVDFSAKLRTVLFGPWDLDLVTESPSVRRKFLDSVLSQVDREYRRATLSYEKGLRQRNKLLFRIREEGLSRSQLVFWDKLLIKNGDYMSSKRGEFIDFVNNQPSINQERFSLSYDKSAISEARLLQYANEEVASATTLVGPHRDDLIFKIRKLKTETRNLANFGSRGEQRMGVLWLKLAELAFVEEMTEDPPVGEARKPILLLDDIFSELDHEHREVVMGVIGNQQTIITTTDIHFVENLGKNKIIKLQ